MIAGVVLAAGCSSRLGRPKQLLPLHGEPLLRYTVQGILASDLDFVVVVIGHEATDVRATVADLPVHVTVNPGAAHGQSTSVVAGLQALPPETEAALFLLGDQPQIDPHVIDALIEAWKQTRAPVVAPHYTSGIGNPVLFDCRVFPELLRLTGDQGARPLVRAHHLAGTLHLVSVAAPAPRDIDTEADYAAVVASLSTTAPCGIRVIPTNLQEESRLRGKLFRQRRDDSWESSPAGSE